MWLLDQKTLRNCRPFKGKPIRVFGPDKVSSKLEVQKFLQKICQKIIINLKIQDLESLSETIDYLKNGFFLLL